MKKSQISNMKRSYLLSRQLSLKDINFNEKQPPTDPNNPNGNTVHSLNNLSNNSMKKSAINLSISRYQFDPVPTQDINRELFNGINYKKLDSIDSTDCEQRPYAKRNNLQTSIIQKQKEMEKHSNCSSNSNSNSQSGTNPLNKQKLRLQVEKLKLTKSYKQLQPIICSDSQNVNQDTMNSLCRVGSQKQLKINGQIDMSKADANHQGEFKTLKQAKRQQCLSRITKIRKLSQVSTIPIQVAYRAEAQAQKNLGIDKIVNAYNPPLLSKNNNHIQTGTTQKVNPKTNSNTDYNINALATKNKEKTILKIK